ncbi:MAG: hypothetical protein C4320_01740 [Armatimonadota bacterium]
MAEAARELGSDRVVVVHGEGLDEVSPAGTTHWILLDQGELLEGVWTPASFGLDPVGPAALNPGATLDEAAAIVLEAISNPDSPRFAAALPTAGVALWVSGRAESVMEGVVLARESVVGGAALSKLATLRL